MGLVFTTAEALTIEHEPASAAGEPDLFHIVDVPDLPNLARASLPGALAVVLEELRQAECSDNRRLARAVANDPDLTTVIMRRANSAFYGTSGRTISDLPTAVTRLGRDVVNYCALRQGLCHLAGRAGALADHLLAHSLIVAELAHDLGEHRNRAFAEQARLAGLLHDFGKLLLIRHGGDIYRHVAITCQGEGLTTQDGERRHLRQADGSAADHAIVAAQVLELSHLAAETVSAIAGHHDPFEHHVQGWNRWDLAGVVQIADALARRAGFADGIAQGPADHRLDPVLLQILDRNEVALVALARRAVEKVAPTLADVMNSASLDTIARRHAQLQALCGHDRAGAGDPVRTASMDEPAPLTSWMIRTSETGTARDPRSDRDDANGDAMNELARVLRVDPEGVMRLGCRSGRFSHTVWTPDGRHLALINADGEVEKWSLTARRCLATARIDGHVTAVTGTADGLGLIVAVDRGRVIRFDGPDWARRAVLETGHGRVGALAAAPNEDAFASGSADGSVTLWTRTPGACRLRSSPLGRHHAPVRALAWSASGHELASAAADGTVRIWSVVDNDLVDITAGHLEAVNDVVWTPEGRFVISGGDDGRIGIWDVRERRYRGRWTQPEGAVVRLCLSPDGSRLLTLDRSGHCRLWGWRDGSLLADGSLAMDATHYHEPGGCLSFNPAGGGLAVPTNGSREIQIWELPEMAAALHDVDYRHETAPACEIPQRSAPGRAPAHVLHLSDLHFRGGENIRKLVVDLVFDLKHRLKIERLDSVVVTGDLADTAAMDEYASVYAFLRMLEERMGVPRERWVVVPGNHDVDWEAATCCHVTPDDLKALADLGHCPQQVGCEPTKKDAGFYPNRFRPYSHRLHRLVYGEPYPLAYKDQVRLHAYPQIGLRFIAYNSSWHIDRCHADDVRVHDDVLVGSKGRLLDDSSGDLLTIGVWHHPLADFRDEEQFAGHLRALGTRLGLHGHIHRDRAGAMDLLTRQRVYFLATGSFSARSRALPPGIPQSYQLLTIDVPRNQVTIQSRKRAGAEWEGHHIWDGTETDDRSARTTISLGAS
ncbi:MAG: HDOD domain-containing protein [bacterium]|nr:HDOD domain-containing protein [bacterium]